MKKTLIAVSLLAVTNLANASLENWVGSLNYSFLSEEVGNTDVDLGAVGVSLGYRWQTSDAFSVTFEGRYGIGVGDDDIDFGIANVDIEIDNYYGAALRGEWDVSQSVYLVGTLSYLNIEAEASAGGTSASDDDGEFGVGAGVGYKINDKNALELTYDTYDGTDIFGIGYRFSF